MSNVSPIKSSDAADAASLGCSADTIAAQSAIKDYLATICPAVLNVPAHLVEAQLESSESIQCLLQFVSNADIMVLFVLKVDAEQDDGMGKCSV
jgi:hypothetical protein